jgi:hypothetical protein
MGGGSLWRDRRQHDGLAISTWWSLRASPFFPPSFGGERRKGGVGSSAAGWSGGLRVMTPLRLQQWGLCLSTTAHRTNKHNFWKPVNICCLLLHAASYHLLFFFTIYLGLSQDLEKKNQLSFLVFIWTLATPNLGPFGDSRLIYRSAPQCKSDKNVIPATDNNISPAARTI